MNVEFPQRLTTELGDSGIGDALFFHEARDRQLSTVVARDWPTEVLHPRIPEAVILWQSIQKRAYYAILVLEGHPIDFVLTPGHVSVRVACREAEDGERIVAAVRAVIPVTKPTEEQRISLTFWTMTHNGPQGIARGVYVPRWEEIAGNYAADTRAAVSRLITNFSPRGGHLLLWSGEAGTGKTWCIRALFYEWRKWCTFHYITDPDVFFGRQAGYVLQVVLGGEDEDEDNAPTTLDEDAAAVRNPERPWRLLLFEDTGEILSRDAKARTGQGLSRLLNIADGFIGQGLRILIFITTNEDIGRLHPAVARPGRCAHHHEFKRLSALESSEWLRGRGIEAGPVQAHTIAELYAKAEGFERGQAGNIGFSSSGTE